MNITRKIMIVGGSCNHGYRYAAGSDREPVDRNEHAGPPLPTEIPTITPIFTPSVPMITVSQNTNCRTGPGVVYDLIGALLIGEEAVVVSKYTSGNYWIINNPDAAGTSHRTSQLTRRYNHQPTRHRTDGARRTFHV